MAILYPGIEAEYQTEFLVPAEEHLEFSMDDIKVFVRAFRKYDYDESGSISCEELKDCLVDMGQGATPKEVQGFIDKYNTSGSGELDFGEFLSLLSDLYPQRKASLEVDFIQPALGFWIFNRADIMAFLKAFRHFDTDGSYSISVSELKNLLAYLGESVTEQKVKQLVTQFDTHGNGDLEWIDFLDLVRSMYLKSKYPLVEKRYLIPAKKFPHFKDEEIKTILGVFRMFDEDGSDSISSNELGEILAYMGQGCPKDKVDELVKKFDTDESGEIEWEEFLELVSSLYGHKKSTTVETTAPKVSTPAPTEFRRRTTTGTAQNTTLNPLQTTVLPKLDNNFVAPKVYPYSVLSARPLPEDVNTSYIEAYLSDEEFQKNLGQTRDKFNSLPAWKRIELKKKLKLY